MRTLASFLYFKVLGWDIKGSFPAVKKCIVLVAPHTSNWDFFLGLLVREVIGVQINYIAKASLFSGGFGWFFRFTGGAPVEREKKSDMVKTISALFSERESFRLALSPEGTRRKVSQWRTGFYYIALSAKIPIILVAFDFGRKQVTLSEPLFPSGDKEADFRTYMDFYKGVKGKNPELGF